MTTIPMKSKNFPNLLFEELKDVSTKRTFSDVTLVSDEDLPFGAHKIVLVSCSPVLRSLLSDSSEQQNVHLQGITGPALESLLHFMYRGETEIDSEDISQFLNAARQLQLKEFVEEKTPDSLSVDPNDLVEEENVVIPEQSFYTSNSSTLEQFIKDSEILEENGKTEDVEDSCQIEENKLESKTKSVKEEKVLAISHENSEIFKKVTAKKKRKMKLDPVTGQLNQYPYKCKICEAPYQTNVGLMFHTKAKHEGAKFHCTFCDYVSAFQPNTRRHMLEKHEGKMYFCKYDKCDYKIGRKEMLNTHVNYEHLGVRYSCDFCAYVGKEKGKLNRHVRMVHFKLKG